MTATDRDTRQKELRETDIHEVSLHNVTRSLIQNNHTTGKTYSLITDETGSKMYQNYLSGGHFLNIFIGEYIFSVLFCPVSIAPTSSHFLKMYPTS